MLTADHTNNANPVSKGKRPTSNVEHPTPNSESRFRSSMFAASATWTLGVERWAFASDS
jgi:hypothetical protein